MNDEIKEIFRRMNDLIEHRFDKEYHTECDLFKDIQDLLDYITSLQQENERLNTELNAYKDEFCKDTIKKYELVMEREYYKSRCEKTIEFCDYLLSHDEVVINRKKYIKQNGDDIITNAIKSNLLGGDEECLIENTA